MSCILFWLKIAHTLNRNNPRKCGDYFYYSITPKVVAVIIEIVVDGL